jgi:hypothetical protein
VVALVRAEIPPYQGILPVTGYERKRQGCRAKAL